MAANSMLTVLSAALLLQHATALSRRDTWQDLSYSCPANDSIVIIGSNGGQYRLECYSDRPGWNLGYSSYVNDISACINLCDQTSGCTDVSWIPGSQNNIAGPCYVKITTNTQAVQHSGIWGARKLGLGDEGLMAVGTPSPNHKPPTLSAASTSAVTTYKATTSASTTPMKSRTTYTARTTSAVTHTTNSVFYVIIYMSSRSSSCHSTATSTATHASPHLTGSSSSVLYATKHLSSVSSLSSSSKHEPQTPTTSTLISSHTTQKATTTHSSSHPTRSSSTNKPQRSPHTSKPSYPTQRPIIIIPTPPHHARPRRRAHDLYHQLLQLHGFPHRRRILYRKPKVVKDSHPTGCGPDVQCKRDEDVVLDNGYEITTHTYYLSHSSSSRNARPTLM